MKVMQALALFTFAASLAVPGASAQGVVLKANVPFAFTLGETHLPSGEYLISSPFAGVIRVQNQETPSEVSVATSKGFSDAGGKNSLVFERYGSQYFLHRILCSTTARMNVDIPAWKPEKKARSREAKLKTGEQIMVAAR